jgi:hypothetical protein
MGVVMSPGKLHGEARAVQASSSEDYLTTLGLLLDFGGEPRSGKKQIPMCSLQSLTCSKGDSRMRFAHQLFAARLNAL